MPHPSLGAKTKAKKDIRIVCTKRTIIVTTESALLNQFDFRQFANSKNDPYYSSMITIDATYDLSTKLSVHNAKEPLEFSTSYGDKF